jgi:tRNA(fMet)-specific endonuclease VapC
VRYLLDTNSCIYLFVGEYPALAERVASLPAGSLAISVITYAELAFGTRNGKLPLQPILDAFVEEVPIEPFDEAAAKFYADLPFKRGSFDRLIAAHALALGLPLISRNIADFADVPTLKVENWTLPL